MTNPATANLIGLLEFDRQIVCLNAFKVLPPLSKRLFTGRIHEINPEDEGNVLFARLSLRTKEKTQK